MIKHIDYVYVNWGRKLIQTRSNLPDEKFMVLVFSIDKYFLHQAPKLELFCDNS